MGIADLDDYITAINIPALVKDPCLRNGHCEINTNGSIRRYTGGYCVVFPYISGSGQKYAVRCWFNEVEDAQYKAEVLTKKLKSLKLPYFIDFEYINNGIVAKSPMPIVRMEWVDAEDFRKFVTNNLHNRTMLERILENFVEMVCTLHKHNISHGDLQHGNILIKPDGRLLLVDYDSMYIDELKHTRNTIAGLPGFQHPSRAKDTKPSPKADYFSELVIYITLKVAIESPELWLRYDCDKESTDLIFKASDFDDISRSKAYNEVYSISPDMAKLVSKLKESCQVGHFEMLKPLEDVINTLGVTTINTENYDSIFDSLKSAKEEAISRKVESQRNSIDMNFSQMFQTVTEAINKQKEDQEEAQKKASIEISNAMQKFKVHIQSIKKEEGAYGD